MQLTPVTCLAEQQRINQIQHSLTLLLSQVVIASSVALAAPDSLRSIEQVAPAAETSRSL